MTSPDRDLRRQVEQDRAMWRARGITVTKVGTDAADRVTIVVPRQADARTLVDYYRDAAVEVAVARSD